MKSPIHLPMLRFGGCCRRFIGLSVASCSTTTLYETLGYPPTVYPRRLRRNIPLRLISSPFLQSRRSRRTLKVQLALPICTPHYLRKTKAPPPRELCPPGASCSARRRSSCPETTHNGRRLYQNSHRSYVPTLMRSMCSSLLMTS